MLPNLIVIGAQKCATSSLHRYLDAHPDIFMSKIKELDFFVAEKQWRRGLDWYRSQFPSAAPVRGESSPNYTAFPNLQGVAERMHSIIPHAKLIYVVRDPVDRMLSQYVHARQHGWTKLGVREALLDRSGPFQLRSRYWTQLSQYLLHYDKSQILVVDYDELAGATRECMRSIYRFLRVDEEFDSSLFARRFHRSEGKREFNAPGRALKAAYRAVKRFLPETTSAARVAGGWRQRLLSRPIEQPVLYAKDRAALASAFTDEVSQLRIFTDWMRCRVDQAVNKPENFSPYFIEPLAGWATDRDDRITINKLAQASI